MRFERYLGPLVVAFLLVLKASSALSTSHEGKPPSCEDIFTSVNMADLKPSQLIEGRSPVDGRIVLQTDSLLMRPLIQPDLAFLKALDVLPETNHFLGFRDGRSVLNQKAIDLALDPDSKTKEEFFSGWIIFLKESRAPIGFISLGMRHSDQLPLTLKDRVQAMLLPLIEKEQKEKGEELTPEKQRKLLYKRVFYLGLSYIIHPEHRGKGYGGEAVRAATKFGKELGATLVLASVYADNQNSKNLLRAAGYTRVNNGIKLEELYISDPLPEL